MELGLSLGDSSKSSFGFMKKPRDHVSNKATLGFCMGLSIGTNPRNDHQELKEEEEEEEEEDDDDGGGGEEDTEEDRRERHIKDSTTTDTATTRSTIIKKRPLDIIHTDHHQHHQQRKNPSIDSPIIQLDLLPNTPVLLWPSSDNGGCEGGNYMRKGLDVNRLPAAEEAAEDGAAVSSSPPNSAASSFQMDFCIYSKNGNHEAERASSRASDEDENGSTRKKLRLSKDQSAFLEESFKEHNTLNPKQKLALAKQLNLRPRQVEVWFQNRRARTKLKQTEVDCEYLKRCCETLTEENRRLHKELQELRALKTSNPFHMQLPATTLTMCPSCERVATTSKATATATSNNNSTEPTSKATGLSLSTKPRFYPFHQPTAS